MSRFRQARKAVFWSGLESVLTQGFSFGFGIAMARLLAPDEFGTIALLYLFTGIATVITDAGFGSALIQNQDTTPDDESTVFWFNVACGACAATVLCLLGPSIARFYDTPILRPLTLLMAGNLWVSSFCTVHSSLLTKQLDFRAHLRVSVLAIISSGIIGISLAVAGWGVWALAWQALTYSLVSAILFWLTSSWRPRMVFRIASLQKLFRFGGFLFASAVIDTIYLRLYTLFIGKLYGATTLGYYDRASQTQLLPQTLLSRIVNRVAFPVYSAVQNDSAKLRTGVLLSIESVTLFAVPIAFGLAVTAKEVISVVFGERWNPAVPILQILAFTGLLYPLHVINLSVLKAQGYSRLFFRLELIKKSIGCSLLIVGSNFGVQGIAISTLLASIASYGINSWYTGKYLDLGFLRQTRTIAPILAAGFLMALAVKCVSGLTSGPDLQQLLVKVAIGMTFWCVVCVTCWRRQLTQILGAPTKPQAALGQS